MAHFQADEKKDKDNDQDTEASRVFYLTHAGIKQFEKKDAKLKQLQKAKEIVHMDAKVTFADKQIIVTQGAHKLDKDTVDKIVHEVVGAANCYSEAEFVKLVDELASIEKPRQEMMKDPAQTLTNLLTITEKGANFIKHNEGAAAPRQQWFSIKGDRLYWRDREKGANHLNRSMEMKSIVKVKPGKTTKALKKKALAKISEDVCFSIIGVRKTLDLQCFSRSMRDEWFTYIEFTHRHYVRAKKKTIYLHDLESALDQDLEDVD